MKQLDRISMIGLGDVFPGPLNDADSIRAGMNGDRGQPIGNPNIMGI